jgi:hypothetical protein
LIGCTPPLGDMEIAVGDGLGAFISARNKRVYRRGGIILFLVILVNLYLYIIYTTIQNDFQRFLIYFFDQRCGHILDRMGI